MNTYLMRISWNDQGAWGINVLGHPEIDEPVFKTPLGVVGNWFDRTQNLVLEDDGEMFTVAIPQYRGQGVTFNVIVEADSLLDLGDGVLSVINDITEQLNSFNVPYTHLPTDHPLWFVPGVCHTCLN